MTAERNVWLVSYPGLPALTVFPSGTSLMVPHTVTVASVASVRALYVKHYKKGMEERKEGGKREEEEEG